jgi:hypothetical protein
MAATLGNRSRLLEKYKEVVRQDGLNTNKNVNIGLPSFTGTAPNLWVSGNFSVGGTVSTSGALSATGGLNYTNVVVAPVTGTVATTAAQSGGVIQVGPAAATTITLPTPVVGLNYTYIVTTAATGTNTIKWITGTGIYLQGFDIITVPGSTFATAGAGELFAATPAGTFISFNCNGTTTGGLIGTQVEFTCLSATLWQVAATNMGSGTLATSFATS